jgi:predicted NBD/HSP70 family sugar kinase
MGPILVVDVGGTHVKLLLRGQEEATKIPSGPQMTPDAMIAAIRAATDGWKYDVVSMGFPSPVIGGKIVREPVNLGPGWMGFDFVAAFGKPVRIINDAALQALGSYQGGRMLFLGLGTGLGSALIIDGAIVAMELAHLPYRKGKTYEQYVGEPARKALGKHKWQLAVEDVVRLLRGAFLVHDVVLGGGNVKKLLRVPEGVRLGDNRNAFLGGFRLWDDGSTSRAPGTPG